MASAWRSAAHRSAQFLRGFRWALTPDEVATVRRLLTDAELPLFTAMQGRDRRHSVDMVHWLRRHTTPSDDLLAAALLHDVGKGQLLVWDRVAFVLLGVLGRRLRARVASERRGRFRRAIWRLEHHPRLGAARLAQFGVRPRVVALVARHTAHATAGDQELAWLQAADSAC